MGIVSPGQRAMIRGVTHSESGRISCPGLLLSLGLSYLGGCGGAPLAEQLATAGAPRAASADESLTLYCIERERSRIAAVAFAMGTRHEISIPEFSGSVRMASDGTPRRLSLQVDLTSAEGGADWITKLVRSERFLHVESFPKASFSSTRIKAHKTTLELEGDLTLRGVTHRLRILATGRGIPETQTTRRTAPQTSSPPASVEAEASFGVDRHAFGIEPGAPHEWVLSDEVDVELKLHAVKAPPGQRHCP